MTIAIICDFGLAKIDKKMEKIENQQFQEYQGLSIHYAPPEAFNRTRFKRIQDFSVLFVYFFFLKKLFFFFEANKYE